MAHRGESVESAASAERLTQRKPTDKAASNTMIGTIVLALAVSTAHTSAPKLSTPSTMALASAAVAHQNQKVTMTVTPGDGASISGEVEFVVKVQAKDPVNSVEFYVGNEIRSTDNSTPYTFKIDTMAETDGPLKLTFAAYTSEGDSAKQTITVNVDNGMGKGLDYQIEAGNEALSNGKLDDAIRFGRVALKIKPGENRARLLLARAFRAKGTLDVAQKFAEDALAADANMLEAADLLSAINLQRGFETFNRGGKREETLEAIRNAMRAAVKNRKLVLEAAVDKLGAATDANRIQLADAAIRAGRYSVAISALQDTFRKNSTDNAVGNRLAYAQLRAGRIDDALITMRETLRNNAVDAYGYGLLSVIYAMKGMDQESDDAIKEALLNEPNNVGVQTAQAYIALKRNRTDALRGLVTNLAKDQGQRTEVNYFLSVLYHKLAMYADGVRAFEASVLAEPANYAAYVQRGNEALLIAATGQINPQEGAYQAKVARTFYETALDAKPESTEALTGLAIVNVLEKKPTDAINMARAAVAAGPTYAAAYYAQSMVYSYAETTFRAAAEKIRSDARGGLTSEQRDQVNKLLSDANNYGKEAQASGRRAGELDRQNLQGRGIPQAVDAFTYFARHGRLPMIVPPR
jgi:tetratricopeptide (TPR) repeat protein